MGFLTDLFGVGDSTDHSTEGKYEPARDDGGSMPGLGSYDGEGVPDGCEPSNDQ